MSVHIVRYGDEIHKECTAPKEYNNGVMDYLLISIPNDEQFIKEPTEILVCEYCNKVFLMHGEITDYWNVKRKLKKWSNGCKPDERNISWRESTRAGVRKSGQT